MPFEWAACALAALLVALLAWLRSTVRRLQLQRRFAACAAAAKGAPPPVMPHVIAGLPVLGSALALGSGGADFLRQCREKHGDAFTLRLLGQRMTFVFAPAALQRYFTAPDTQLTFAPAVQQFTHRVFGLPPQHVYPRHIVMLQTLRHELIPSALPQHTARLLRLVLPRLQRWPAAGQMELVAELKALVFEASVGALFGPCFLGQESGSEAGSSRACGKSAGGADSHAANSSRGQSSTNPSGSAAGRSRAQRLQDAFFAFEGGFEMAASPLPHLLQPRFRAARRTLLAALRESHGAGHFEGTVAGTLIEACGLPDRYVPNMLLALLWASQANAVPTIFWVLGLLLLPENERHLEAVVAEAQQAAGLGSPAGRAAAASGGTPPVQGTPAAAAKARARAWITGDAAEGSPQQAQQAQRAQQAGQLLSQEQQQGLVELACNRHSRIAAAISETLRLRCFSIDVRIAASDGVLPGGTDGSGPGIWVQQGDVVAISPYESHLDSRLYGDAAAAYNPGREGMRLGGSTAAHAAVVGVGGVPGLAFGGGKYRCPGRYFAEAELALIASLLLLLFDWRLLPRERGAGGAATAAAGSGTAPGAAAGSGTAAAGSSAAAATHAAPGDPAGLLPPPDLRKLVGIKVPAGPCWVQYHRRQLGGS